MRKQSNSKKIGKVDKKKRFSKTPKQLASVNNYQDAAMEQEELKGSKFPLKKVRVASNDPQWYFKQDALLKDVASFSYAKPLGSAINTDPPIIVNAKQSCYNSIPGLMSVRILPVPGISINATSPINLGAQNVYTRVRYKNSGAANYDPQDLMLYYLAMANLYSAWNWAKRIYGYASTYSQVNWYQPAAFAAADNVDLENVVNNLADYRARLNILANQINAFCVPSVFSYMIRISWLFSNIYTDSDTSKAQNYMYTPVGFYKYDETSSPQGGILSLIDLQLTPKTVKLKYGDIISTIQKMINALQYSSDIGNMSGDTLKEFGSDLFRLSLIEPDYRVDPVSNKEVLMQIENLFWNSAWDELYNLDAQHKFPLSTWNITQDPNTNFIKFQPTFTCPTNHTNGTRDEFGLNFHHDNPTPEDVIVASRLNCFVSSTYDSASDKTTFTYTECGSEIVLGCDVFMFSSSSDIFQQYDPNAKVSLQKIKLMSIITGTSNGTAATYETMAVRTSKLIYAWTAFDWAPTLFHICYVSTAKNVQLPDLKDWDVYTMLSKDDYTALNLLALQSMFNVPN